MRAACLLSALLLSVCSAGAGDVTVQVHITKRLTKKTVAPAIYNLRGAAPLATVGAEAPVTEFDRTVVMLSGKVPVPSDPETVTIEQRNSRFEPDLVVIPVGSTVNFPNFDPIFHNVFSLSRTLPFDLGFYPKSKSKSEVFDKAGVVQVYCHIHANMYAAIVVTDNPWYGKPDADGKVMLKDVPAGHYKAQAWHKVAGLYYADVDVPAKGRVQVDISVPVDAEPHK